MAVERVLLTADTVGGVWTYALDLARGLTLSGVEVGLATLGAPLDTPQRRAVSTLDGVEVWESPFKLEWMADPWDDVGRAGEWLLGIEERFRPGVVHLNQYCYAAQGFRAPVLVTGHSCVLSWWRAVHGEDAPPEWTRYREEVTRGLRAASLVTAPTRAMLGALEEHYGALSRTAVVPNGREFRVQDGVQKQPLVFAAGRLWDEAKNLAALEEIAPSLPWPVYVAGDARHPDGGTRSCTRCRFLGKLRPRQVEWWMDRASIFVAPVRYEPFGLSILEAALAGCALVLGDVPSLRELWEGAAVFVPPNEPPALQAAVRSLIENPEQRLDLARDAHCRAQEFSLARMLNAYREAYASLQPLTS